MKKLGIIGAMKVEVETLQNAMTGKRIQTIAGMDFCEGLLEGLPAVVVECGVGKVNAAVCAQILCSCYQISHLVNTGVAGSLNAKLDICDLLVSKDAMYYDVDCQYVGYAPCVLPGMPETFEADDSLIGRAFAAAESIKPGHTHIGRVATGDCFVAKKELKEKIVALTQASCVEMEGAAIAHTAYKNGVPFVILRAISDKADDSAEMDYPTFEANAAAFCARLTEALARDLAQDE
ncbi:MAG: 5'-methylthioadenosine/adenosylhomocysteine nucleosidase [Candidatus Faecousia sp.]|nr:5'-methylthioadenosine/adenosylhomocysteine nucleosidase [Bacillota bacterium]MDD7341765.1 5'-methylthioadenosine/adenosylhomocysteine nucleosidase [Bacillota bacterium]MDY2810222.1 5'-methylthioadenosine/adenosylhomocysteine nucleosidase [Candidatus Faecousia sp.]